MIATALLARAAPDGHTMMVVDVAHGANPALNDKMPYDTLKDLSAVSLVLRVPMLLLVNPAFPAQSVKELIAVGEGGARASTTTVPPAPAAPCTSSPSCSRRRRASTSCTSPTRAAPRRYPT